MGRAKKKTLDEQLQSISNEIEACETRLESLHQEYQAVLETKKEMELASLYELIQENGLTVDDVAYMIQQPQEHSA